MATALLGVLAGQWLISSRGRWIKAAGPGIGWARLPGAGNAVGVIFRSSRSSGPARTFWLRGVGACSCSRLFYTIIDVIGLRAWAFFFVVIGVNAITIYVASRIIPFSEISRFLLGGAARLSGSFGPVLLAIGTLVLEWLLLLYLYRNRIFLRV